MRKLYLLTDSFPHKVGESTFILPELEALKKDYDITVISSVRESLVEDEKGADRLDKQIRVMRYSADDEKRWFYYLHFLRFWIKKECWREIRAIVKAREKIPIRIWKSMHFYAKAECLYRWIHKNDVVDHEESIYYSYWYNEKVLAMTMHRKKYPNLKVIARAHGYDLYAERNVCGWLPFKKVMDGNVDRLFFISEQGRNYYVQRYGVDIQCGRYRLCRIGAQKQKAVLEKDRQDVFLLVSCASVIPLKRIDLIVRTLAEVQNCRIRWVHFGTGSQRDEVECLAHQLLDSKANITYCFKGYTPNEAIMQFYETEQPDCFISVSSSEGCPVSIQEALAFGIPVIGTDVGGTSETIDGNGYLLRDNPSVEEIVCAIEDMYHLNCADYNAMRRRSLEIWKERYDVEQNMGNFAKEIGDLCDDAKEHV